MKLLKKLLRLESQFDVIHDREGRELEPRFTWPEVLETGEAVSALNAGRITRNEYDRRWAKIIRRGQRNAARGIGQSAGELSALVAECKARRAAWEAGQPEG
jgi:hypothetical protein